MSEERLKVFLSYPSERLKEATEIFEFLRSLDLDVWFDKESLVGGQDWDRERAEAQKEADLICLVGSKETVQRAGVIQREVKDILQLIQDKPLGHVFLLTIRTEDVRLPPEIARYHYIDHFRPDWKVRLARAIELKTTQLDQTLSASLTSFFQLSLSPEVTATKSIGEADDVKQLEVEYFTYNIDGDYWSYVNAEIISAVMARRFRARSRFTSLGQTKNEYSIRVEEFFRADEFISLRLFEYWYHSDAAHPNWRTYTLNFGGDTIASFDLRDLLSFFDLRDLVDRSSDGIRFLMQYCERDLRQQMTVKGYEEVTFLFYPESEAEGWNLFSQFNFDAHGITINFSPYDVFPYAAGGQEVRVPWGLLREHIAPLFAKELGAVIPALAR
jgi:hypothetical protein